MCCVTESHFTWFVQSNRPNIIWYKRGWNNIGAKKCYQRATFLWFIIQLKSDILNGNVVVLSYMKMITFLFQIQIPFKVSIASSSGLPPHFNLGWHRPLDTYSIPDSKACWAHVGPTWSRQDPRWANVGPTTFAIGIIRAQCVEKFSQSTLSFFMWHTARI